MLAPLVPLMYLDVVVDCLLKGMDEQFNSMKFNLADSSLRVLLVLLLLRFWGIESYVGILFFSTIFNASLSLGRLLKVTNVKMRFTEQILLPVLSGMLSVSVSKLVTAKIWQTASMVSIFAQILLAGAIFLGVLGGISFLTRERQREAPSTTQNPRLRAQKKKKI